MLTTLILWSNITSPIRLGLFFFRLTAANKQRITSSVLLHVCSCILDSDSEFCPQVETLVLGSTSFKCHTFIYDSSIYLKLLQWGLRQTDRCCIKIFIGWICFRQQAERQAVWQTVCDQLVAITQTGSGYSVRLSAPCPGVCPRRSPVSSYRNAWKTQSQPLAPSWAGSQ